MTTSKIASVISPQVRKGEQSAPPRSLRPSVFWRIAEDIPPALQWSLTVVSLVLPFLLWWLFSTFGTVDPVFLPTPSHIVDAWQRLWEKGFLSQDITASVLRVGAGFLLAGLVSIPVGILMGAFPSIRSLFEPFMALLRYMPAPAFIPLLILYLGIGEVPKIVLIFIGTVFYNTLMIMDAVKFVPKELIETTYTLGGQRFQVLLKVITPYVLPNIIDSFRINVAASWNLVIVAELVAAEMGLGKRILIAQKFLQTDEIFAILIILGVIGFAIDLSFRWLLKTSCRWAID